MKKTFLIILLIASSLSYYACKEDPTEVGNNILSQTDSISTITYDSWQEKIVPDAQVIKRKMTIQTSGLKVMLNGKSSGYEAFSIIWFKDYRDTLIDATILKSELILNFSDYQIGTQNSQYLGIYKVQKYMTQSAMDGATLASSITENTTARDILSLSTISIDENMRTSFYGVPAKNSTISIPLDSNTTKEILNGYNLGETNFNGLAFLSNIGSGIISTFYNHNADSIYKPYMKVVITKNNKTDTVIFRDIYGESVIYNSNSSGYIDSKNLITGFGNRIRLKFDVSKVPANVIINKALLTLSLDSSGFNIDGYGSDSLMLSMISDSSNSQMLPGSYIVGKPFSSETKKYIFDIAPLIQKWIMGQKNYGVEIYPFFDYGSLRNFGIVSPLSNRKDLAPRLEIKYFLPPK